MLMPAGVLVVLVLGAIAVDLSIVHLGERELITAAEAAANDAVTYGLDEGVLREGGSYALDPSRVERAVMTSLDASGLLAELTGLAVTAEGSDGVRVTLRMDVGYVFAKALPGGPDTATVEASATASVARR